MTYTYTWADAEQSALLRDDGASIPTDPANRDYAEFLASNETAADYVAPPAPPALTPEQKLEAAGLTVTELRELLNLN